MIQRWVLGLIVVIIMDDKCSELYMIVQLQVELFMVHDRLRYLVHSTFLLRAVPQL